MSKGDEGVSVGRREGVKRPRPIGMSSRSSATFRLQRDSFAKTG
jgi:hypothetical protein